MTDAISCPLSVPKRQRPQKPRANRAIPPDVDADNVASVLAELALLALQRVDEQPECLKVRIAVARVVLPTVDVPDDQLALLRISNLIEDVG